MYGIWVISDYLGRIKPHYGVREATKEVNNAALDVNFALPGDPGWPLNQVSFGVYYGFSLKDGIRR